MNLTEHEKDLQIGEVSIIGGSLLYINKVDFDKQF